MHLCQRLHHRHQNSQCLVIRNFPALGGNICLQTHTFDIFHHEICCIVFFKIVLHRHDIRRVLQLGKNPCLIQKALHAVPVVLLSSSSQRYAVLVRMPGCKTGRHIFLNRDFDLQCQVITQISNAESSHAQYLASHVAAIEQSPHGQRQKRLFLLCAEPTARAN